MGKLAGRQIYGEEIIFTERRRNLCLGNSFLGKGLAFWGEWSGVRKLRYTFLGEMYIYS